MKDIKEDLNKWRDSPCSWVGRLNIVKISSFQIDLRIQHYPNQNPGKLFCRHQPIDSKVCVERQKTQNNTTVKEKNKVRGLTLPTLNLSIKLQ